MVKIIKIGLCGRSGSGKGYVSKRLKELGFFIIDTDNVYKNLVLSKQDNECKKDIRKIFGNNVFSDDGVLNKTVLASIVFKDGNEDLLNKLNKIAHKHIKVECEKILASIDGEQYIGVIIDAPLLFESNFDKLCDKTCCVLANEDIRLMRIVERDNISKEDALKRLKKQLSDDELKDKCDFVIVNNNNDEILRKGINELLAYCQNKQK